MKLRIWVLWGLLQGTASMAWGQTPLVLGEREAFLGNTGIARLGSSAAGYYNPAGLMSVSQTKISASGSLFQTSRQKFTGTANTESKTFESIPTHVSTVGRYKDYRYAFTIMNVQTYDYTLGVMTDLGLGVGQTPMRMKATGSALAIGPSIAMPVTKNLFAGLSLMVLKSDIYLNRLARIDATGPGGTAHLLASVEDQLSTYTLVPIFGTTYVINDSTTLGVRFVAPSVALSGNVKTIEQAVGYLDNGGAITDLGVPETHTSQKAKLRRPMELGVGLAQSLPRQMKLYADATYSFSLDYEEVAGAGDTEYKGSLHLNTGLEYMSGAGTWSAGGFYMPNISRGDAGEVKNYYGITGGYIHMAEHIDSGIGLSYVFGSGKTTGLSNKASSLGILLTTAFKF